MFPRTERLLSNNYYRWMAPINERLPLTDSPRPTARPVTHELESTGAVGWFAREYPYAAMITNLRARRHKHYCELYVSALDLTIYFYPGRALTLITDYADLLQAFDKDAYTHIHDVILPAIIFDLLPQPIAEEITPELWTRTQRVQLSDSEPAEDNFSDVDSDSEFDRPPVGWNVIDIITTAKNREDDDYEPKYTAWDYHPMIRPSGPAMYTIDTRQYTKRRDNWGTHTGLRSYSTCACFYCGSYRGKIIRGHFLSNYTICNCSYCYMKTNRRDIPAKYDDFPLVINLANYFVDARESIYARDHFDDSDIDWDYE